MIWSLFDERRFDVQKRMKEIVIATKENLAEQFILNGNIAKRFQEK